MAEAELANRRIVVTGAASGMGKAIAGLFAREGAALFLLDVNEPALHQVDIPRAGRMAIDVSDPEQVDRAIAAAAQAMHGIDAVLNVAGIVRFQRFAESGFDDFLRVVGVNLFGPFHVCKAALPHLVAAEKATIVNITSIAAFTAEEGSSAYSASKAGLGGLTRVLAAELGPNIRVNAIAPGMIDTPMLKNVLPGVTDLAEQYAPTLALKRAGNPEDIAEAALFLTSDRSSFITGTTLTIDGGSSWH